MGLEIKGESAPSNKPGQIGREVLYPPPCVIDQDFGKSVRNSRLVFPVLWQKQLLKAETGQPLKWLDGNKELPDLRMATASCLSPAARLQVEGV